MAKKDKLAQEARKAMQAGMSYGKWKAMQPRVEVKKQVIPDGMKACEQCGGAFTPKSGQRFCCVDCRKKAARARGSR